MKKNEHKIFKLFTSTFLISAFTFGVGYVIVPLMKKKFVDELRWLEEKETLDFVAIAQSSPGAIAVNASIMMGYQIAGFPGAILTIIGTILPPMIIISVISVFYAVFKESPIVNAVLGAMQAGVSAVIVNVVFDMSRGIVKEKNIVSLIIMAGVFVAVYFFKANIILIIIVCGIIGVVTTHIRLKKRENI